MRIFCTQHKTGFITPRRNPIRCENRGHVLGMFIFHGDAKAPAETLWQYCCNCEHFCPIELDQGGSEACPACSRRISQRYVCDRCFTLSFESSSATQAKNFQLTPDGMPQPSCPGCLQEAPVDLPEHDCEKLGAGFKTGLNSCPFCHEHLDVEAQHEVDALTDNTPVAQKSRIPLETVSTTYGSGWVRSCAAANLLNTSVKAAHPPATAGGTDCFQQGIRTFEAKPIEESAHAIEDLRPTTIEQFSGATCTYCGSPLETRYAFCWSCGHSTRPEAAPSKQVREIIAVSNQIIADGDEPTITRDVGVQPAGFSWKFSGPTKTPPLSAKLKLTATVVIGLLLAMLGGFLVKGLLAQFGGGPDSQQVASTLRSTADVAPAVEPTVNATAEIKTTSHPTIDQAEEDLRKLHERRIGASSSDRLTILQLIANTEKQYPDDFRFPYERAKLAINGVETRSHDEAFNALSLAAGTAIKANKADEMLKGLETDRMSDFHKLSHGHREWMQIIEALKRKDATLLGSN